MWLNEETERNETKPNLIQFLIFFIFRHFYKL